MVLSDHWDGKVVTLLVLTCVVLTVAKYWGGYPQARAAQKTVMGWCGLDRAEERLAEGAQTIGPWRRQALELTARFDALVVDLFERGPHARLHSLQYWCGTLIVLYFVVPALVIRLVFRERLRDYGLKIRGWYRGAWIYISAFGVVFPLVWWLAPTRSFQRAYPFYREAGNSWSEFLGWEIAYVAQFFALEFFFRGVLIHGVKHRVGVLAVPIMTVPYCMIHFGKPAPETFGAIIAGLFLGTLSLWSRSIWLGVLIHVSVALSMDILALRVSGRWLLEWF